MKLREFDTESFFTRANLEIPYPIWASLASSSGVTRSDTLKPSTPPSPPPQKRCKSPGRGLVISQRGRAAAGIPRRAEGRDGVGLCRFCSVRLLGCSLVFGFWGFALDGSRVFTLGFGGCRVWVFEVRV